MTAPTRGIAGRIAAVFIDSRLTPLVIIASILLGLGAVLLLPREEEPQIVVPMIDVFVQMPGASSKEVEERVTRPMEKLLWEIPGVEYIYSTTSPGMSMAIVRFKVGQDEEKSIVRLNQKLFANFDLIPPGASQPLVKPRSIDDVPILALTLSGAGSDPFTLRKVAAALHDQIKTVPDVSEVRIIGGQRRQLRVDLDPARMASRGVAPAPLLQSIAAANRQMRSGSASAGNREFLIETGGFLKNAADAGNVVVGGSGGRAVYLRDVADIVDGPEEAADYVFFGNGPAVRTSGPALVSAVTISISKRKGTNAIVIADKVLEKVEAVRGRLIPSGISVTVTRNYGETAAEKSNELLLHMLIAILSVSILIGLTLGRREAGVVATAIPVTLALTLAVFYLAGYTLNRVTLFALIFSIGILVDDAIVVVENIVRHFRMPGNAGRPLAEVAVEAVDEVGNPTILATFTVIAAILPMAFVRGLMGPYMRPIPVGASAAILFSLLVAFIVTPWAAVRLLKSKAGGHDQETEGVTTRFYRKAMDRLLHNPVYRYGFLLMVVFLLLGSASLVYFKFVQVKMLPFDNKSEFQIVIDMPTGSTLEKTASVTREIGDTLSSVPEVLNFQAYVGTASPYNFNGLVRHYFLRRGPDVADIQVNLVPKGDRKAQSHDIAKRVRPAVQAVAGKYGARVKVSEVPPGPPVLQTLVAEVYGPEYAGQVETARKIKEILSGTKGVVDVDWYVEDDQPSFRFVVDEEKAALSGVTAEQISATLRVALSGTEAGLIASADRQGGRADLRPPAARRAFADRGFEAASRDGATGQPGAALRGDARRGGNRRQEHLPQEPDAGRLCHRRCRGGGRKPRLCDLQDQRGARQTGPSRRLQNGTARPGAARERREDLDEVGRRVAHHLRGVPRHGARVRRRHGADLHTGGRLVPVVHHSRHDHGRDPVLAGRHSPRPRLHGGVLHRHLDDRLHRRRRHRGAQLDHPGRLRRTPAQAGDAA